MAQQTINTGAAPDDGSGDKLRTAFTKTNANFTELYTNVSGLQAADTVLQTNIDNVVASSAIGGADGQIQYNNGGDYGGDANLTFDDATGLLTIKNVVTPAVTVVHSPPTDITCDFAGAAKILLTFTDDASFVSANLANGRGVTFHFIGQAGVATALAFPAAWKFLGTKPAELAADKIASMTLESTGATDADVRAVWAAES